MRCATIAMLLLLTGPVLTAPSLPSGSIYHLNSTLLSQSDAAVGLDTYRGHPVLITMFYASCPAACPLLIDTLRAVERSVDDGARRQLRVLMISIDPERDTTAALRQLAQDRHIDLSRWTLAHADAANVRKIAATLNIQYRRLPDGQFSHSSIVSLLSPEGELLQQSSTLSSADPAIVAAIVRVMQQSLQEQSR